MGFFSKIFGSKKSEQQNDNQKVIEGHTSSNSTYDKYLRSPNTPPLQFETAPYLYATVEQERDLGMKPKAFDEVEYENLEAVVFISRSLDDDVIDTIYGGKLTKYQGETQEWLTTNGNKILSSKYAKSVTAWIYVGEDSIMNYEMDQKRALEKLGRNIPIYHLIDVWKLLKEKFGEVEKVPTKKVQINPIHNRVPLKDIKHNPNSNIATDKGIAYLEEGEKERKEGNIERAIELYDLARYHGYSAPALYEAYRKAYRKIKDYDNEIAILDEAIRRLQSQRLSINQELIIKFKERREKAIELKLKQDSEETATKG